MTYYYWDFELDNVLLEQDENGDTIAEYTQEPARYGELISQTRDGQAYYYNYDDEGNAREVTDANENVVESATYSAFGDVAAKTSNITNPFGYKGALGYYTNADSDDYYVRRRTYEPTTGRWFSPDSLGFLDGPNLYNYCANDPINLLDASGQAIRIKQTVVGLGDLNSIQERCPKGKKFPTGSLPGERELPVVPVVSSYYTGCTNVAKEGPTFDTSCSWKNPIAPGCCDRYYECKITDIHVTVYITSIIPTSGLRFYLDLPPLTLTRFSAAMTRTIAAHERVHREVNRIMLNHFLNSVVAPEVFKIRTRQCSPGWSFWPFESVRGRARKCAHSMFDDAFRQLKQIMQALSDDFHRDASAFEQADIIPGSPLYSIDFQQPGFDYSGYIPKQTKAAIAKYSLDVAPCIEAAPCCPFPPSLPS